MAHDRTSCRSSGAALPLLVSGCAILHMRTPRRGQVLPRRCLYFHRFEYHVLFCVMARDRTFGRRSRTTIASLPLRLPGVRAYMIPTGRTKREAWRESDAIH
jgi:hypothetical protein